jgi:hypothetical protein
MRETNCSTSAKGTTPAANDTRLALRNSARNTASRTHIAPVDGGPIDLHALHRAEALVRERCDVRNDMRDDRRRDGQRDVWRKSARAESAGDGEYGADEDEQGVEGGPPDEGDGLDRAERLGRGAYAYAREEVVNDAWGGTDANQRW